MSKVTVVESHLANLDLFTGWLLAQIYDGDYSGGSPPRKSPAPLQKDDERASDGSSFQMTYEGQGGPDAREAFQMGGHGLTYDASGVVTGGTISSIKLLADNKTAITITGFGPQSAVDLAAALGLSSQNAYETLVALLDDDTLATGSKYGDGIELGAGNDVVSLGFGNDGVIKWKAGNLTFNGGAGSDSVSFQAQQGVAYPTALAQQMVVNLTTGTGLSPYGGILKLSAVENVTGTSAADLITGNGKANIIGDGFADGGADVIDARGGNDTVKVVDIAMVHADGGSGFDVLQFVGNIDLQDPAFSSRIQNFEKFQVFDFYILTPSSVLRGDGGANWFACDNGIDTLEGRGGNDILDGGDALNNDFSDGADIAVYSGLRSDYAIMVQGGTLTITDKRDGSPDGVDTVVNVETLRFADMDVAVASFAPNLGEGLFGTSGNDDIGPDFGATNNVSVYGLAGNDTLSDGGGDDLLVGGRGNDTYLVSGGADKIVELAGEGNDTVTLIFQSKVLTFSLA